MAFEYIIVTFSFFCFIPFVRHMKKLLKETIYTHYKNSLVNAYILHISRLLYSFSLLGVLFFWGALDFFF